MSQAIILDANAAVQLPAELFDVQTNIPLIHQVVNAQLAAARQGTHATKTRGMVSGGGAKPWRQKGTGRARQGSRRAPQWTGGGTVHGPQPRDYSQRTPKKMIAAALRGALSDRAREERIHVVNSLVEGDTPSTKQALAALKAVADSKALVVLSRDEDVAWMSLRNVVNLQVIVADQLNAYDVLVADQVVFTLAALSEFVGGELTTVEVEKADEPEASAKAKKSAKKVKAEAVDETENAADAVEIDGAATTEARDGLEPSPTEVVDEDVEVAEADEVADADEESDADDVPTETAETQTEEGDK